MENSGRIKDEGERARGENKRLKEKWMKDPKMSKTVKY